MNTIELQNLRSNETEPEETQTTAVSGGPDLNDLSGEDFITFVYKASRS
jgi:hypothetical protein